MLETDALPAAAPAPSSPLGLPLRAAYFLSIGALAGRIAWLDEWSLARYLVLAAFLATVLPDRVAHPRPRSLALGVAFFFLLSMSVTYLPDLWFGIAYYLNHAKNYLWNANAFMCLVPGNDAAFLWRHAFAWLDPVMAWIYVNGFDMVVWIPVLRSLVAYDAFKMARYALGAHLIQFPMIMPFYTAFRVDEVWSVLGHNDRLQRGWTDEQRLDIGANCFPSMHTSVAFAILLLAQREKSVLFRRMMAAYASAIIFSTMYMEVHWVIDVLAGFGLGWAAVRCTDWVLEKVRTVPGASERAMP